jgi:hypothetical protein
MKTYYSARLKGQKDGRAKISNATFFCRTHLSAFIELPANGVAGLMPQTLLFSNLLEGLEGRFNAY